MWLLGWLQTAPCWCCLAARSLARLRIAAARSDQIRFVLMAANAGEWRAHMQVKQMLGVLELLGGPLAILFAGMW